MDSNKEKENIQNTLKALQEKSLYIEKLLEKGNDVIVFQIGSHSIKYGFANQTQPQKIPNILGYYRKKQSENTWDIDYSKLEQLDPLVEKLETFLKKKGNLKGDLTKIASIKVKQKNRIEIPPGFKNFKFDTLNTKEVYFEEQVYVHQNNPNFVIRHPIRHGSFNLSDDYSHDDAARDIETLINYILRKKLALDQREFPKFSIILIVPDVFHRGQIKSIINIFLKKLAFRRIFLHQESVMATFGCCISQACVIDIGSDKINICCVDEGVIIPQTIVRKFYGGRDIDIFLHHLLTKKNSYSYMNKNVKIDIRNFCDMQQIEGVKEIASTYIQNDEYANAIYEGTLIRDRPETLLVTYSDAFIIAHAAYFHSVILNTLKPRNPAVEDYFNYSSAYFDSYFDPEDYYDDPGQTISYGLALLAGTKPQDSNKNGKKDIEVEKTIEEKKTKKYTMDNLDEIMDPYLMQDLDDLICVSISQIPEGELRRKIANSILIIGGGCEVIQTVDEIEDRLIDTFSIYDPTIERVEVFNPITRDIRPHAASWVGGTVIQRLESMKELWITRARWLGDVDNDSDDDDFMERKVKRDKLHENCGVKLLREKLPFLW